MVVGPVLVTVLAASMVSVPPVTFRMPVMVRVAPKTLFEPPAESISPAETPQPADVERRGANYLRYVLAISLGLAGSTNFRPRSWLSFNVAGTSRSAICIFRVHDPVVQ